LEINQKVKDHHTLITSVANVENLKSQAALRNETQNRIQTICGIAIKEDKFMPDNMAVFTNSSSKIIAIMQFEKDGIRYTEVEPEDFYKSVLNL